MFPNQKYLHGNTYNAETRTFDHAPKFHVAMHMNSLQEKYANNLFKVFFHNEFFVLFMEFHLKNVMIWKPFWLAKKKIQFIYRWFNGKLLIKTDNSTKKSLKYEWKNQPTINRWSSGTSLNSFLNVSHRDLYDG